MCILVHPQNVAVNGVSDISPRLNTEGGLSKPTAVFTLQKLQPMFVQSVHEQLLLRDDSSPKKPSELLLLHVLLPQSKTKNHQ